MIRAAGYCHDLGHAGLLNHGFDAIAHQLGVPAELADHEDRSVALFRFMVQKYNLNYSSEEANLICALIKGEPIAGYPAWLFEIIANHFCEVDVDKEYLRRDAYYLFMNKQVDFHKLMQNMKLLPVNNNEEELHIVFHSKDAQLLLDLFQTRQYLHRIVYRHPAVVRIELLLRDMLQLLANVFEWQTLFDSEHSWRMVLTDHIIGTMNGVIHNPTLFRALSLEKQTKLRLAYNLFQRVQKRQFYPKASISSSSNMSVDVSFIPPLYPAQHHFHQVVKCAYSGGNTNPLDKVHVYLINEEGDYEVFPLSKANLSQVSNTVYSESFHFDHVRN